MTKLVRKDVTPYFFLISFSNLRLSSCIRFINLVINSGDNPCSFPAAMLLSSTSWKRFTCNAGTSCFALYIPISLTIFSLSPMILTKALSNESIVNRYFANAESWLSWAADCALDSWQLNIEMDTENKGLGLKNIYERARMIGATIHVESRLQKGTRVTISMSNS